MSPHPQITPAPELRPRQNSPYLSSLYAELSSLYPELYSSYSYDAGYYSSLLDSIYSNSDQYSSLLNEIYSGYSFPYPTATDGGLVRTGSTTDPTGVSRGSSSTSNTSSSSSGGLSTGAKIGIGVGVPLAVLLLIGIGVFLWCAGKRKGKKSSTTVVAPAATQYQPHAQIPVQGPPPPQMGYASNQGYMPGYQQQQQPQQGYQSMAPPQYAQPNQGAYGGAYAKPPEANVVELEQEYHFARPGVIEMGDGVPEAQGKKKKGKK